MKLLSLQFGVGLVTACAITLITGHSVHGAVWTGTTSSSWNTAANWSSPANVPDSAGEPADFNGTATNRSVPLDVGAAASTTSISTLRFDTFSDVGGAYSLDLNGRRLDITSNAFSGVGGNSTAAGTVNISGGTYE